MNSKNKYFVLVIGIIVCGLLCIGGTYAFLSFTATVTNATYNGESTCFDINFDEGDAITGNLFQSSTPKGGLYGTVKMNISEECNVAGRGTIKLNVGSNTSSLLLSEGALKYAVYEYADEEPVSSGTITSTGSTNIYENFVLPRVYAKIYYIYIWLDGNIADNDYVSLSFDGNIDANFTQTEDCVITYMGENYQNVWTQVITNGQPFTLPESTIKRPYKNYNLYDDVFNCNESGSSVAFNCGTVFIGTEASCWG